MTMKRILHPALMFMVLMMSGCGFLPNESTSTTNTSSSPSSESRSQIDFAGAENHVRKALGQLTASSRLGQSPTVKPVKDEIDDAIQRLGNKEDQLRALCTGCTEKTISEAVEVLRTLTGTSEELGRDPQRKISDLEEVDRTKLQEELKKGANSLKDLSEAKPKGLETPSPTHSAQADLNREGTGDAGLLGTLFFGLKLLGVALALGLVVRALMYLWKRFWRTIELGIGQVVMAHLSNRETQPDYTPKLSSLSSAQTEISSKLSELNTEVRALSRLVRDSLANRRPDRNSSFGGFDYQSQVEDVSPKDEPEFPVSAVDYLGKMNRFATVVRPDFQNGILVNDPGGTGELVLIRDSRLPDDTPLFVVPSATQFHTKQDFYTYYQKYYECVRPSAGDVWIIGPALVEKVPGGWQLREKGMLEIRQ